MVQLARCTLSKAPFRNRIVGEHSERSALDEPVPGAHPPSNCPHLQSSDLIIVPRLELAHDVGVWREICVQPGAVRVQYGGYACRAPARVRPEQQRGRRVARLPGRVLGDAALEDIQSPREAAASVLPQNWIPSV